MKVQTHTLMATAKSEPVEMVEVFDGFTMPLGYLIILITVAYFCLMCLIDDDMPDLF